MIQSTIETKFQQLTTLIRELDRAVVAFSAGVDSTFVLRVSADVLGRNNVVAVTGRSQSVPEAELAEAAGTASEFGIEHVLIDTDEFEDPDYLSNPTNRCYHCKSHLYAHLTRFMKERDFRVVVNGTNADDLGDFRPGLGAADEYEVRSPLAEVGLTKAEVRELSRQLGLSMFDKPASPCLSSRVPYGEAITPEKLRMIESGERILHALGIRECRVRHHDRLARIEVPPEFIARLAEPTVRDRIEEQFRSLGYQYVTLDLRGFRSGSLNEVVTLRVGRPGS